MERQIATTRSQSARLLKCGVPAESADMSWFRAWGNVGDFDLNVKPYGMMVRINEECCRGRNEIIPAFSLSTLLGLLPSAITDREVYFQLQLTAVPHEEDCYKWDLSYYSIEAEVTLYYNESPDPIEACVLMVEKLTANGYKLNGIEKGGGK